MKTVRSSWRRIEEVLRENSHTVFRALRKPVTAADLQRLERVLPARLPPDFLASLNIHDGLRDSYLGPNRLVDYWALLPARAILGEWQTLTDLQAECGFGGCQLKVARRIRNDAHWRRGWVPVMDSDGDKILLDLDPGPQGKTGQVLQWSNSGSFSTRVLADSFREWLDGLADALSNRRFRLDEFGGIWLSAE